MNRTRTRTCSWIKRTYSPVLGIGDEIAFGPWVVAHRRGRVEARLCVRMAVRVAWLPESHHILHTDCHKHDISRNGNQGWMYRHSHLPTFVVEAVGDPNKGSTEESESLERLAIEDSVDSNDEFAALCMCDDSD
jgi:hypothetical protein